MVAVFFKTKIANCWCFFGVVAFYYTGNFELIFWICDFGCSQIVLAFCWFVTCTVTVVAGKAFNELERIEVCYDVERDLGADR